MLGIAAGELINASVGQHGQSCQRDLGTGQAIAINGAIATVALDRRLWRGAARGQR